MANALLSSLGSATVASSCSIWLTLLLRKSLRTHFGPSLAYFLWLLVPTSLLALVLPAPSTGLRVVFPVSLSMTSLTSHVALASTSASLDLDWVTWLVCAWGIGGLLFCARLVHQQRQFIASLGGLTPSDGVLLASSFAGCPVVFGVVRPQVVVPSDFAIRYAPAEQALILAHERMHIRRGDLVVNALWAVARCVFWFNPLVHIAGRRIRFDQELACDADVMRTHPRSAKPYANAMLRTQLVNEPLPLGCRWPSIHPLKERIMLLKQPPARGPRRVIGQTFVGICVLTLGYATWAAQSSGIAPPTDRAMTADSAIIADSQSPNGVSGEDASRNPDPVTIDADHSNCSAGRSTCTWSGHFKFSSKEFVILADEAKTNRADSGFLLVVRGTPATFTRTPSSGAAVVRGAAERIVLDGATGKMTLTGHASLTQGNAAMMAGERLIYQFP